MKNIIIHGFHISGNDHMAIAVSVSDPEDVHYFTPQTMDQDGLDQGAYTRAIGWAFPGPPCDCDDAECEHPAPIEAIAFDVHPRPWSVAYNKQFETWSERSEPRIVDAKGELVVSMPQNVNHPGDYDIEADCTAIMIVKAVNKGETDDQYND